MNWDAIARFLAGESSDAEIESVSRWMADHPEEAAALTASHDAALRAGGRAAAPVDVNAAWQRVGANLDEVPAERPALSVERTGRAVPKVAGFHARRSPWAWPAMRAAAAVAVIATGALVWRATDAEHAQPATTVARDFATAPAQRDSVVLADGTGVLLGPGSSLHVEAGYGDGRRTVRLEGEALFDVRHDDARPFVVHTSDLLIHDLGTTFTVRTMNGTGDITNVAVTVGAVRVARAVAGADSGVVLREGDMATIGVGPMNVQRGVALDDALAWTRGRLVFRDTPLPAVAAALERWYGIQVEVDPELGTRTLTASFEGEPLAKVLEVIRLALDAPVTRTDSTVIIGTRPTAATSPT